MTKLSRAQTPEEKIAKGEFILHVAERIIRDEGLDALSMDRLVQETSFAKGTLYLYFTTRHEILASLFMQMLTGWHRRLSESLSKARNYDEFCARYMRELTYDPLFLPNESEHTFAEIGLEEKAKISHRARALTKLIDWLKNR